MKPKLPSIVRRGLAYAFDLALLMIVWFAVVKKEFAVSANWSYEFGETVSNFEYLNPGNALLFLGALVLYGTLAEAVTGRTIGKFLVGIKVVAKDGHTAGAKEAALRNILKQVDAALLGAPVLLSERNLSLGDRLAGTVVVGKGGRRFTGSGGRIYRQKDFCRDFRRRFRCGGRWNRARRA
jgi:uncharacterized RDD family membrane protein YckC